MEEVRVDILDRPISGGDTDRAGPTWKQKQKQTGHQWLPGGGGGVGETGETGAGGRGVCKTIAEPDSGVRREGGKGGKAPEKPELVAGKKPRFQQRRRTIRLPGHTMMTKPNPTSIACHPPIPHKATLKCIVT